jgi:hypothetical protein
MKLVKVRWVDAEDHPDTWVSPEEVEEFGGKDCAMESVGWLVKETKKYLTLGSDRAEDGYFGCVRKIATGMILSIEDIN